MPTTPTLGQKIAAAREAAGMSQRGLARALSCHQNEVWRWENARAVPRTKNLIQIARVLNVDLADLLDSGGEEHGPCDHPAVVAFVERLKQLPLRHQVYLIAVVGCMVDSAVQDARDAG